MGGRGRGSDRDRERSRDRDLLLPSTIGDLSSSDTVDVINTQVGQGGTGIGPEGSGSEGNIGIGIGVGGGFDAAFDGPQGEGDNTGDFYHDSMRKIGLELEGVRACVCVS